MSRRLIICTSLALLFLDGCAPHSYMVPSETVLTCINVIDQNGTSETISSPDRLQKYTDIDFLKPQPYKKVLQVFSRDACGNLPSIITSYHANGLPNQYIEVMNGRANGVYLEWYSDGTQKISASVIGGIADLTVEAEGTWLFDGVNKAWDEDGRLQAELKYCKGELNGVSTYFHKNGCIWKKVPCLRGQIEGAMEIFLENETLFQTSSYSLGVKNGPSTRYWCDSSLAAEEYYCSGKLENGRYFNSCGKLIAEVVNGTGLRAIFGKESVTELQEYVNGTQDGEVQIFARLGGVVQTYHVKNGVKHGEEYWYFDRAINSQKPRPKLMLTWYDGKIQGFTKTWYPNGHQESQREMSTNAKNGLSTAWYEDGNLMLIEQYEKDKLIRGEYYKKGDFVPVSLVVEGKGTATLYDADGSFLRKTEYNHGFPDNAD